MIVHVCRTTLARDADQMLNVATFVSFHLDEQFLFHFYFQLVLLVVQRLDQICILVLTLKSSQEVSTLIFENFLKMKNVFLLKDFFLMILTLVIWTCAILDVKEI